MDWMDELNTLHPAPAEISPAQSWDAVQRDLGVELPQDYRQFAEAYGAVGIGEFIWMLSPFSDNKSLELRAAAQAQARAYGTLKAHHPAVFQLPAFPSEGSFLPWALTDNGDYLGWIVSGPAENWQVAILDDESNPPERFEQPFGPFILSLIKGETRPASFPDDIYDELPFVFATVETLNIAGRSRLREKATNRLLCFVKLSSKQCMF